MYFTSFLVQILHIQHDNNLNNAVSCLVARVQSYRLLYTDARPSLCVHSIPWRRRVHISFCHVHPLGTCASLPIKISLDLSVLLREVWRPAYQQHTSTTVSYHNCIIVVKMWDVHVFLADSFVALHAITVYVYACTENFAGICLNGNKTQRRMTGRYLSQTDFIQPV